MSYMRSSEPSHEPMRYRVRWEARKRGSIGAFSCVVVEVMATSHADAVAQAEPLFAGLELRMGGDAMAEDDTEWRTPRRRMVQPMTLPCQTENFSMPDGFYRRVRNQLRIQPCSCRAIGCLECDRRAE